MNSDLNHLEVFLRLKEGKSAITTGEEEIIQLSQLFDNNQKLF
jgi:hypothetical protein